MQFVQVASDKSQTKGKKCGGGREFLITVGYGRNLWCFQSSENCPNKTKSRAVSKTKL